jgi:hypothetical protein
MGKDDERAIKESSSDIEWVDEIPQDGSIINIEGKKGKSLFHKPLTWGLKGKEFELLRDRFQRYGDMLNKAKEDRLLAMIGFLSMEEALDLFLRTYIIGYGEKLSELSTYWKIYLARSLRLIPEHILHGADVIRDIRNQFAHHLEINFFDNLSQKHKEKLLLTCKQLSPESKGKLTDVFVMLVMTVILGLGVYSENVKIASEYIRDAEFLKEIEKRMKGLSE